MAKKYMGENDPALDALYEELGAIGTNPKTRADRRKQRQIERQIRKIRAGRLGGLGGLFRRLFETSGKGLLNQYISQPQLDQFAMEIQDPERFPTPAQDVLGFGRLEFDIGSRLGLGDAIEAQEDVPIEEIIVDATKRAPTMLATEPKFDISSKLGRNQIRSIEKRRRRMGESPDAFRPDYAIEFLPDHLKEKYRDELLDFAATFSPHESQRASLTFDQYGRRTTPAGQYAHGGILSGQADMLSRAGRGDDTMLMHVTPDEVAGIASLAPGMMTINPETGLPEAGAFRDMLGFAAPFLISMIPGIGPVLGPAIGGAVGAKIRGGDTRDMLLGAATGALGGKMFGGMAEAGTQATGLESLMSGTDISSLQNIIPEEQFAHLGSLMGEGMNVGDALASMDLPVGQMGNITSSLGKIPYQPGAFIDSGVGSPISVTIPEVAPWNKPFEQMSFGEKMAGIKGGGLGGLKSGLMTLPGLGTIAGTGLGTQRDMTRRFEEQLLENKEERERRKAEMYAMYPENIPYRGGGSIYKNRYINGNWS